MPYRSLAVFAALPAACAAHVLALFVLALLLLSALGVVVTGILGKALLGLRVTPLALAVIIVVAGFPVGDGVFRDALFVTSANAFALGVVVALVAVRQVIFAWEPTTSC